MPSENMGNKSKNEETKTLGARLATFKEFIQNKHIEINPLSPEAESTIQTEFAELFDQLKDENQNIITLLNDILDTTNREIEKAENTHNQRKTYLLQSYKKAVLEASDSFTKLFNDPDNVENAKNFKSAIDKLSHEKYSANLTTDLLHKTGALLAALVLAAFAIFVIALVTSIFIAPPLAAVFMTVAVIAAGTCGASAVGSFVFGPLADMLAFTSTPVKKAAKLEYQLSLVADEKSEPLRSRPHFSLFNKLTQRKLKAISTDEKQAVELRPLVKSA